MAQSTGSMFANMFGLKPFLDALNDPETQQYARQFLYFIADTHRRVCEIEEMLRAERGLTSALPQQYGTPGTRGSGIAAGAGYHGGSQHSPQNGGFESGIRRNGEIG